MGNGQVLGGERAGVGRQRGRVSRRHHSLGCGVGPPTAPLAAIPPARPLGTGRDRAAESTARCRSVWLRLVILASWSSSAVPGSSAPAIRRAGEQAADAGVARFMQGAAGAGLVGVGGGWNRSGAAGGIAVGVVMWGTWPFSPAAIGLARRGQSRRIPTLSIVASPATPSKAPTRAAGPSPPWPGRPRRAPRGTDIA
jgi:hypothetical protein